MKVYTIKPEYNISHLLDNYDWASLGHSHIVDVGGSQGYIAVELAKRFKNLIITVQDIVPVVNNPQREIPQEVEGKVHFMVHDYFQPQTVEADVYFFRWVLHNLSDQACYKILRALIPVLKPGVRIILQDLCMPEPGTVPLWRDKDLRSEPTFTLSFFSIAQPLHRASDIHMTTLFNAKERTVSEWRAMFIEADSRFTLTRVIEPKGSALGIIELIWEASASAVAP
jgi:SAM-dependent methyltransferase